MATPASNKRQVCALGTNRPGGESASTNLATKREILPQLDTLVCNLQRQAAADLHGRVDLKRQAPGASGAVPLAVALVQLEQAYGWLHDYTALPSPPSVARQGMSTQPNASSSLLFRATGCGQSLNCCCGCTRSCGNRCLWDCFVRLYLWQRELRSLLATPMRVSTSMYALPMSHPYYAVQCVCSTVFSSYSQLALGIGSVIYSRANPVLARTLERGGINLNIMDYSQQLQLTADGKIIADPTTGHLKIRAWPESGLCPYCMPHRSVDNRKRKKKAGESRD